MYAGGGELTENIDDVGMVAIYMNPLERNGWTLRVTMSAVWQQKPFFSDDFKFSYFDMELQNS